LVLDHQDVREVDPAAVDVDDDLGGAGLRIGHVLDDQRARRAVLLAQNSAHAATLVPGAGLRCRRSVPTAGRGALGATRTPAGPAGTRARARAPGGGGGGSCGGGRRGSGTWWAPDVGVDGGRRSPYGRGLARPWCSRGGCVEIARATVGFPGDWCRRRSAPPAPTRALTQR